MGTTVLVNAILLVTIISVVPRISALMVLLLMVNVMNGKCYTYHLILPDVPIYSPLATSLYRMEHTLIHNDAFLEKCDTETANAISQHKQATLQEIDDELTLLQTGVLLLCTQLQISNHFDSFSNINPAVDPLTTAIEATSFKDLLLKSIPVNTICVETDRILWHQRLCHLCDKYFYSAHKFIDVVPKFKRHSDVMSKCSTCIKAKMTKIDPGPNSTKRALHHGQGLAVDFSFSGVQSKKKVCCKDFVGINCETCWVLITDHHKSMQYGKKCRSKASLIEWLRSWLHAHSQNLRNKYVFMDQDGELYSNPDIINMFTQHQYKVHPTGTDSSHQNGHVECAHRVIGDHVRRALLIVADLHIKF